MKKIDINNVEKQLRIDSLDHFRQDVSDDLNSGKVSAVLVLLVNRVNELTDLILKMRDRKKPGPKPSTIRKKKRKEV